MKIVITIYYNKNDYNNNHYKDTNDDNNCKNWLKMSLDAFLYAIL